MCVWATEGSLTDDRRDGGWVWVGVLLVAASPPFHPSRRRCVRKTHAGLLKTKQEISCACLHKLGARTGSFWLIFSTHPTELIYRGCFVGIVSGNSSPERISPNSSTQTQPTKTY